MEEFYDFSVTNWHQLQVLSRRMQAVNELIEFFNSEYTIERGLADDCELLVEWLVFDLDSSMEAYVRLAEEEDG